MSKWYMNLFRRLLSAAVLSSLVRYQTSLDWKYTHLKFRIHLVEGLSVQYSGQCKVSGHHGGNNTIRRLTECHVPRRIPPTEKKHQPMAWHDKRTKREYYSHNRDIFCSQPYKDDLQQ